MKKFILSTAMTLALGASLSAAPADPTPLKVKQPDGKTITIRLNGDEFGHFYTTVDGYAITKADNGYFHYITGFENGKPVCSQQAVSDPKERDAATIKLLNSIQAESIAQEMNAGIQVSRIKKTAQRSIEKSPAFPNKGEVKGLVILVEFANESFLPGNTKDKFNNMLNQPGYKDENSDGSAYDYFTSQSHDQFKPHFDVYGPVKLSKNYENYGSNDSSNNDIAAYAMVKEACELLDSEIDFTQYDSNNDGKVDLVFALYAGYGENGGAGSERIWPHASDLSYYYGDPVMFDGKEVGPYACSCELRGNASMHVTTAGIGVFCHEFSHCLGLYDIYDTNGINGGSGKGFGKYSIMDQGCYNNEGFTPCSYTALERSMIGWLTPTELGDEFGQKTLQDINQENQAYILYNPENKNEYFLFENRQQTGWDKHLPGHGMLISHVNYNKDKWEQNLVNATEGEEGAIIIPANNKYNSGEESHLYPIADNNSFTDISAPAAIFRNGTKAGKPLTDIKEENGLISFTYLDIVLETPVALDATDIQGNCFTANWESVKGAEAYTLTVTPIAEVTHPDAIVYEDFSLFKRGAATSPSNSDISKKLDEYTTVPGWKGEKVYEAGGMCKLSTGTTDGYIMTPKTSLPQTFTIVVDAKDYVTESGTPDKAKLYIGTTLGTDGNWIDYKEFDLSQTDMQTVSLTSTSGNKELYACVGTIGGRALIDNLFVLKRTAAQAPAQEQNIVINDIKGTSYKVTGLKKSYKYSYSVQATAADKISAASNIVYVITTTAIDSPETITAQVYAADGILHIESEAPAKVCIHTIDGKCVFNRVVEHNAEVSLDNGIYIVTINGKSQKVIL